jgi:hypothetical protein
MPISMQFGEPVPADDLDEGIDVPAMFQLWQA